MTETEKKLKRLLDSLIPFIGWERAAAFVIRTDKKAVNEVLSSTKKK